MLYQHQMAEKNVQVVSIEYFPNGQPRYITSEDRWFDNGTKARLWNIMQDAKDGDILVTVDSNQPFIYKGCFDPNHPDAPVAYCGIDSGGDFTCSCVNNFNYWLTEEKVQPATKEQRDLLFQKMKELIEKKK